MTTQSCGCQINTCNTCSSSTYNPCSVCKHKMCTQSISKCTDGCEEVITGECVLYNGSEYHLGNIHLTKGLSYDNLWLQVLNVLALINPVSQTNISLYRGVICKTFYTSGLCNTLIYEYDYFVPLSILPNPLNLTTLVIKRTQGSTTLNLTYGLIFDLIRQGWKVVINDVLTCGTNSTCGSSLVEYKFYTKTGVVETLFDTITNTCNLCNTLSNQSPNQFTAVPVNVKCQSNVVTGKIVFNSDEPLSVFDLKLNGVVDTNWSLVTVSNINPYQYEMILNVPIIVPANIFVIKFGDFNYTNELCINIQGCQ